MRLPPQLFALHSDGNLARKCLEQMPLFRNEQRCAIITTNDQHANDAASSIERQIDRVGRRKSIRSEAGNFVSREYPIRDRGIRRSFPCRITGVPQHARAPFRAIQKNQPMRIEHVGDVRVRTGCDVIERRGGRQLARHCVERRGAPLTVYRYASFAPRACSRNPAASELMTKPTVNRTAAVSRYSVSLMANE